MAKDILRIGAVGDLHCARDHGQGTLHKVLDFAAENCDVLLLCGDMTDYGKPEEAMIFAKEMPRSRRLPVLAVFGNHDYETNQMEELSKIFHEGGIHLLDGDTYMVGGVGFAGTKGFCGGFGQRMLEPWGEPAVKAYVQAAVEEQLKLERALAKLQHTPNKVVLLHYSPIQETVEGEPCETYAFLGSSRLEDPINRYEVSVVFHGHAHHGSLEGRTREDIPVFNVSAPLLKKHFPDTPPVRIYNLPIETPAEVQ